MPGRHSLLVIATIAFAYAAIAMPPALTGTVDADEPDLADLSTRAPPPDGSLRLDLVDQEFAFGPDDDIHLTYRLVGDIDAVAELRPAPPTTTTTTSTTTPTGPESTGSTAGGDGAVTDVEPPEPVALNILVANYPRIDDDDDIARFVGSEVDPDDFEDAIDGIVVTDVRDRANFQDDGSVTFELAIPTDAVEKSQPDRMKFDSPGLYPLRVQLIVGTTDPVAVVTAGTIVQRLPGPEDPTRTVEPIDLTLIAAVDDPGPLADDGERAAAASELENISGSAAAVESPFTLSLPPSVVESATATAAAREDLSAQLIDDELVAVPAASFDISSAVAADQLAAYQLELRVGEDMLTNALPMIPSRRDVWVATEPLSAGGAQALRDLGTRMVVMSDDLYVRTVAPDLPATDRFVEIELPDGGTLPLLVIDPIGIQLTPDGTAAMLRRYTRAEWAVATIAEMLAEQEGGSVTAQRTRALATPDLTAPDPRLILGLEQIGATTPGVRFAAASTLTGLTDVQRVGGDPVSVELPVVAGPPLTERVNSLNGARLIVANASSMLAPDDPRPEMWNAELDRLISTGYPEPYVDRTVAEIRSEADELTGAIVAPEPFTFTLTGRSGDIEMRIGNTGAEELNVKLRLSSPKLTFPDGDRIVALRPSGETSVIVPVRARANGTSPVTVEILTPLDQPVTEPVVLTSRVNALTGLGQVLTGGLVIVLLTWWLAHFRSRRRDLAAAAATDATGDAITNAPTDAPAAAELPAPDG
jgi:hypothetical protein